MMGFGMSFGLVGLLFMLIFWGGLILLAVWLVRVIFSSNSSNNPSAPRSEQSSNALEILAQRYARGEITREQYEIMKRDLS
jgi:putative membrane protein